MQKSIDIKNLSGQVILSTPINEESKRKRTLQKEDYIMLKFSLSEPIYFPIGCYVDDEEIGLFEVTSLYNPTYNTSTGGYDYELQLDAYYYKWKNKIFKFTPETGGQEASWNLTAGLDVHLGIFLRNLTALGYNYRGTDFSFSIDSTVENSAKLVSYENTNMIDALSAMAETWECEWWVTDNVIHFGRCEYGTPVNFEIGNNVEEMTSSEGKNTYATRIYAFGSTRNIPVNYRPVDESIVVNGVVQRRLMLPSGTPYIDAYPNMNTEQAIEQVVVFDDIYPKTNGTINSVSTYDSTVDNEDGTTTTETFYRFKDNGINFSKDYILEGEELHIIFQSGSLNGMDFGVVFNPNGKPEKLDNGSWNPDAQLWEIVANEDYGRKLPDDVLKPKVGDTYVLYGWDSTKIADLGLVAKAEQELKEKAEQYVEKSRVDPNSYTCKMMSDYMYGVEPEGELNDRYSKHFDIGDRVSLVNNAYFKDGIRQSRIIGFEYSLDMSYDSPVYTVGETSEYSRIGDIENKVETLTLKGQTYTGGGGSSVYVIGTNDTTPATNRNVYSALRIKKEYVPFEGYVDQPVRKNDNVQFNTVQSDNFASKNFTSGPLGSGHRIKDGDAEFQNVTVRGRISAFEYLIQQVKAVGGKLLISAASMKAGVVEELEDGYKCYFNTDGGTIHNQFVVNDQAFHQVFNGKNQSRYWRLITEVGSDYIVLSKTDCETGSDIPKVNDEILLLGNRTDINRMSAIMISAYDENSPYTAYYSGINSFSLEGNESMREGNLTGIVDKDFGQLEGFGLFANNVFLKGRFWLMSGKSIEGEIDEINTSLKVTAEGIEQSVKKGDVISSINQSEEAIKISASRIEISGNTIFKSGDKETTVLNAIEGVAQNKIEQNMGQQNLLKKSNIFLSLPPIGNYTYTESLVIGETYTLVFFAKTFGNASVKVQPYSLHTEWIDNLVPENTSNGKMVSISFVANKAFAGFCSFGVSGEGTAIIEWAVVVRGTDAPSSWIGSMEDVSYVANEAKNKAEKATETVQSYNYLTQALGNDTLVNGGLIASSLIKLGAVNSGGKWVEAAGINGTGTSPNDVRFYAGGDLTSAIRLVNNTAGQKASFVVTHGGKLIATNVNVSGKIAATSGEIGGFLIKDNSLQASGDGYTIKLGVTSLNGYKYGIAVDAAYGQYAISAHAPGGYAFYANYGRVRIPTLVGKIVYIQNNYDVSGDDFFIISYASSSITVNLHNVNYVEGHVVFIRKSGTGNITVKGKMQSGWGDFDNNKSTTIKNSGLHIFIQTNKGWISNYMEGIS